MLISAVSQASFQLLWHCCLLSKSWGAPWQQLALGIITGYDCAEQHLQQLREAALKVRKKNSFCHTDAVEDADLLEQEAAHHCDAFGDSIFPGFCSGVTPKRGSNLRGGSTAKASHQASTPKQPYLILRYAAAPKTSTTTTMTVMVMATMLPVEGPSVRAVLSPQPHSTHPSCSQHTFAKSPLMEGNFPSLLPKGAMKAAGHALYFHRAGGFGIRHS